MSFSDTFSVIFSVCGTGIGLSCIVYVIFKIKKDHEEEFKRLHTKIENQENRLFHLAMGKPLIDVYQDMVNEKKAELANNELAKKLNQGLENDLKNIKLVKKK